MPNPLVISIQVETGSANSALLQFNKGLSDIETVASNATRGASAGINNIEKSMAKASLSIRNQLFSIKDALTAAFGVGLAQAARSAIEITSTFELAELGIESFVKAGESAVEVFKDLKAFALTSPLEFSTILETSNQLLALETNAKDLIPTLGTLSTAVFAVTGGKDVPDRLKDVIRALGQIRTAGALTGEELRQLRNASIVTDKELARAFGVTTQEFKKAIADRAVPAEAVIRATLEAAELRFSKFGDKIQGSAKVAFSNFKDALGQAADAALRDYLPRLVDGINSLSSSILSLAKVVQANRGAIEASLKAIASVAIIAGLGKLLTALVAVRFGWTALTAAFAANPIGAAALAVGAMLGALDAYVDAGQEAEMQQLKLNLAIAQHNRIITLLRAGKGSEDLLKMGFSADQLTDSYKALIAGGHQLQKQLEALPAVVKKFEDSKLTKFKLDKGAEEAAEAERKRVAAVKASEAYLEESQRKEVEGLARVREAYRQKLADVKGFKEAERNVEVGFQNFLKIERDKQFADVQKDLERSLSDYKKFYQARADQELKYVDDTRDILDRAEQSRLQHQITQAEQARDSQFRQLESVAAYTVEQRLAVEQAQSQIEIQFQNKSFELKKAALAQQLRTELDQAKRQSYDALLIDLDKFKEIEKAHLASLELRATTQAIFEAKGGQLSTEQELALQEKLSAIRIAFEKYTSTQEAAIRESERVKLDSRLAALTLASEAELQRLRIDTDAAINASRESAAASSTDIIRQNNIKVFDGLKRGVEGVFDATVSRAKSFGQALGDAIKLPILAAFKEIISNKIAAMLFEIFGGGKVTLQGGQPSFSGGITGTGGGGNVLGRLLGLGGAAALGGGGGGGGFSGFGGGGGGGLFGIPGAPGGTPGFSGPVGLGGTGAGGIGSSISGIGGSLAGTATSLKGILTSLGNIGRTGGGVFGPGSTGGALARPGVGGAAGGALLAGGGALAFDGLRRGGALGLAETTAGGALIGFKFGGPLGAAIGAGIGAIAGTIRLFVKTASEKIVSKVKSIYGITISSKFARDPLLGIIKQGFGGNIDVGIRSAQIRDLIELYAMSTGQNSTGINTTRPISSSFALSGGSLSQQPTFSNGLSLGLGQASNASASGTTVIQLDPDTTTAFLQGQAIQTIANHPRAVQGAVLQANQQNASRRAQLGVLVNPGLMVS